MLSWSQVWLVAAWNLNRQRKRFATILALFFAGYLITNLSVLIVTGVLEVEYLALHQAYGGDPRVIYVWQPASTTPVDYHKLVTTWLSRPELERVTLVNRTKEPVRWAGLAFTHTAGQYPPLAEGRYFTIDEMTQGARVALVGRAAGVALTGAELRPGQVFSRDGQQWTVVGLLADEFPATRAVHAFGNEYVWVPLRTLPSLIGAEPQDNAIAYLYSSHALSTAEQAGLRAAIASAMNDETFELYHAAEHVRADERYMSRLIGLGIGGALALFAGLNLSALVRYWMKRRRQELGIRLTVGASLRDIARLILAEQVLLLGGAYAVALVIYGLGQPLIRQTGLLIAFDATQMLLAGAVALLTLGITHWDAMRELRRHTVSSYLRKAVI